MTSLSSAARSFGRFPTPLAIDAGSTVPLHRQIYQWFQTAIVEGFLTPGQTVLSTRELAVQLGVSRAPVLAAFEQLAAEGYFVAVVGAGTKVAWPAEEFPLGKSLRRVGPVAVDASPPIHQPSARAARLKEHDAPWLAHPGAFRTSLPALDRFPAQVWGALVARHSRSTSLAMLGYGDPMGYKPLREAIAAYLGTARGVRCTPENVIVVAGSQQGLQIAAHTLLDAGDRILMEDPGYPGARSAFTSVRLEVVSTPIDADGMNVTAAPRGFRSARAAYVTPSHQYPLGIGMSTTRRIELLRWADAENAWIIEDDYDGEFRFGTAPAASLQGIDASGRVIYVGTFSKVMYPALRVGYLVVPEGLVPAFVAVRAAMDIAPPTMIQAALADFISEGHFSRHLRRMRMLYGRTRERLVLHLQELLGAGIEIEGIEAGMHVTLLLPPDVNDVEIAGRAAAAGISVTPLSTCAIVSGGRPGLVLGYGNVDLASVEPAVRILAKIIGGGGSAASPVRVNAVPSMPLRAASTDCDHKL